MNKKRKADCEAFRGKIAAAEGQLNEMISERWRNSLVFFDIEALNISEDWPPWKRFLKRCLSALKCSRSCLLP